MCTKIPKEDLMTSSMTSGSARERILSDHDHLRRLMKLVAASAFEALGDEKRRAGIRDALAELRAEFERHLEYEEMTLGPLLASADPWGHVRAEQFLKEHAGQRALLVALTEDASDGVRTIEALVEEIAWFVRSLERDMVDEEATFLNAETLGEEFFATDQERTDGSQGCRRTDEAGVGGTDVIAGATAADTVYCGAVR
jgi:hypothetical protein